MAEDKKSFLQGKMNKDIDARLLPNGEYRSAQNIQITTSDEQDVGSITNIKGNTKIINNSNTLISDILVNDLSHYIDLETIGCFFDEKNNRIFYFVTNNVCPNVTAVGLVGDDDGPTMAVDLDNNDLLCAIYLHDNIDSNTSSIKKLVSGLFLNFSKTNIITGVNLLDNLLFFTDNLNQPRRINIDTALANNAFYDSEEKISVAKFAPFMPPLLLEHETTTYNQSIASSIFDQGGVTEALYEQDLYQTNFYDAATSGNLIGSYFFYRSPLTTTAFSTILFDETTNFIYLNSSLSEVLVGYNEVFVNTISNFTTDTFFKIQLNSVTGEVLNIIPTGPALGETTDITESQPQLIANQGDDYTVVTNPSFIPVGPTSSMQTFNQNNFPEDYLKEKFVRFSYRFKFKDGEYSTIAPFTQICFIPKTTSYSVTESQKIFKTGSVHYQDDNGNSDGMVNSITGVNLNIILPSNNPNKDFEISNLEILYKESDKNINDSIIKYLYKSTLPYKTLPKDQLTRVYDNVPLAALAQEVVGNRVVYGNFVQDRTLPSRKDKIAGLDFSVGLTEKFDITNSFGNADFNNYYLHKEYPFHSVKQRRTYEVGVVLSDKFGRQSPVLTSNTSSSSVDVKAKPNTFHSSSWSSTENFIHSFSPGSQDYCGDALNITFNSTITSPYAKGTIIPINTFASSTDVYDFDLFKANFGTDLILSNGSPGSTGGVMINNLYFYSTINQNPVAAGEPNVSLIVGSFLYKNAILTEVQTGYSELYINTNSSSVANFLDILKVNLNSETGEILSTEVALQSIFTNNIIFSSQPVQHAFAGEAFEGTILGSISIVSPEQTSVIIPNLGEVYKLIITNFNETDLFSVGEYLKGQEKDFVEIVGFDQESGQFIIYLDGAPSLSYTNFFNNDTSQINFNSYIFFKYKISPYGWYSYRVVVKQTEQEYHNVYVPNVVTIDINNEGHKSYFPIIGDNINKITRDIEFSNIQETGLSTSKSQIYPKVLPLTSATTVSGLTSVLSRSIQSDKDLINVISVGTAKEQDLKDEESNVLSFIYETNKNPLIAQIPYGNSSINIGQDITSSFKGNEYDFASNATGISGNTRLKLPNTDIAVFTSGSPVVTIGDFLSGKNTNLVKIEAITGDGTESLITCDGEISDIYFDTAATTGNKIYSYKYGLQDRISVFETKPFESKLDIYYETSTAGYVHELNEAVSVVTDVESVSFINTEDFKESTIFYDEFGTFQNNFAATLNILDQNGSTLTLGDGPGQINVGGVEITQEIGTGPNELSSLFSDFIQQSNSANSTRFVIFNDENTATFKLKPREGLGNFTYDPLLEPTKYIFTLRITVNGNNSNLQDEVFIINNVEINLINEAPVISSSTTVSAQQNNDDPTLTPIHTIIATNASASEQNNTSGLQFRCRDLQSQFIENEAGTLQGFETIFDSQGEEIVELRINNTTGEIFLTNEFQEESLNVNFAIRITDGSDYFSDENFQAGDDEHGGLFVDHEINLTVSDGLIVLNGISSQAVPNVSQEELPGNNINIFQNEGSTRVAVEDFMFKPEVNNPATGIAYGSYWTTTPNAQQIENMPKNQIILDSAEPAGIAYGPVGIFLCSQTAAKSNNKMTTRIWALRVIDNIPKVVTYYNETSATINRSTRSWFNHHLLSGWGHIFCQTSPTFLTGGGTGTSSAPFSSSFCDIDGSLAVNPSCPYHPDYSTNNIFNNPSQNWNHWPPGNMSGFYGHYDPDLLADSGWILNQPGTHPRYGSANNNSYEGSFPYYNNEGEIVHTISKPEDMNVSTSGINFLGTVPPFHRGDPFLFKCKDTVVLNTVEYEILYVVEAPHKISDGVNEQPLQMKKVFLCRKQ